MRNIWTIAKREYDYYFTSPVAYVAAFLILFVLGIFFAIDLLQFQQYSFQDLSSYLNTGRETGILPFLFVFLIPALTMRLVSDENRTGTMELLLTAPVRDWELILGKWAGGFLFILTVIAVTLIYPILLNRMVDPGIDWRQLASSYLGVILLAAAFLGLGVGISAMFVNQIAAFIVSFLTFVFLYWVVGIPANLPITGGNVFSYLSMSNHFSDLSEGVINLSAVVYYSSLTFLGLFLGTLSIEVRRWR